MSRVRGPRIQWPNPIWKAAVVCAILVVAFGAVWVYKAIPDEPPAYWERFTLGRARELVARRHNDSNAHAVLGMHLWSLRRYPEALGQFRTEELLEPADYDPHVNAAEIMEEAGMYGAEAEWRRVADLAPTSSWAYAFARRRLASR